MATISVIVPVYKAEAYLADCVDSILSQTFSDYEVILVDDGSPDDCGRLCDAYASQHDCISVIHQNNQGQAAARNHALLQAKGDWICFVDSDDMIHPRMLESLYQAVRQTDAPIAMCGMLEAVSLPQDFYDERDISYSYYPMNEETLLSLYDQDKYPAWVACAKLIRKELILSYPFREGRVYEDNEAVCRWVCQGGSLAATEEKLYFYRGNPESTTKSEFRLKRLDYLWALESIIEWYTQLGFETMRQRFVDRYADAVVNCCNGARYLLQRPDVVKQIEKQTRAFLREKDIRLTKPQFESILEVTHPQLAKIYWPVNAVVGTLQRDGVSGVMKKIRGRLGKEDGQ